MESTEPEALLGTAWTSLSWAAVLLFAAGCGRVSFEQLPLAGDQLDGGAPVVAATGQQVDVGEREDPVGAGSPQEPVNVGSPQEPVGGGALQDPQESDAPSSPGAVSGSGDTQNPDAGSPQEPEGPATPPGAVSDSGGAGDPDAGSQPEGEDDDCDGGACPSCTDGTQNQDESGVDCGGASCAACPSCTDGLQNQDETGVDCGGATCVPCLCSYGTPEVLGNPNYPGNQLWSPSLSQDGLTLYAALIFAGLPEQIIVSTRTSTSDDFGYGYSVPSPVNDTEEGTPFLTTDGLSLYFFSTRAGGLGGRDLYVATRASTDVEFSTAEPITEVNSSALDHLPWVSSDELTLYFSSARAGGAGAHDIWMASRANVGDAFSPASVVSELNSPAFDDGPTLSADRRVVVLASDRPGGAGWDLYQAVRASTADTFSGLAPLTMLNSGSNEYDPALTADGNWLYFVSNRNGGIEIWRSARTCPQ